MSFFIFKFSDFFAAMGCCESNAGAQYEVARENTEAIQLKKAWTEIKQDSVWNHYDKIKTLGEGMTGAVYALRKKDGDGSTCVLFSST